MTALPNPDPQRLARPLSRSLTGAGALFGLVALPSLAGVAAPAGKSSAPKKPAAPVRQTTAKPAVAGTVQFNRDIRPILSDNCFACHGPDKNKRAAGLRLDVREDALSRSAIVPGKPEKSRALIRVFEPVEARQMPPPSAHKKLTAEQKNLLKRWVAEGAPYEAHWAYIAPKRPAVPQITDGRYAVRNPIDAFVAAKLREKKILPSPEADRRTVLRRVYLDVTGIPPTPQETEAFLADSSPDAYGKVVERLLASPHYGERMALPWLDVVRYSDTVGFHGDQNQNAWPYRDYVIDSFNQNKPFDQFTTEQLAGDLLTPQDLAKWGVRETKGSLIPAEQARLAATCFNRLNMVTREGGAQPKEYLAKYAGDRVRTVGMAWLGQTTGCAECHDHKYDPISQRDFYALAAFFADVKQWGVYADYGYTPNPDLKGYNNDYPFPPETKVESAYLKGRIARDHAAIAQLAEGTGNTLQSEAAARSAYDAWRTAASSFLGRHADGWETPQPEVRATASGVPVKGKPTAAPAGATPAAHRVEPDGSVLLLGREATNLAVTLKPETPWVAAVRVELLPHAENAKSVLRPGLETGMLTLSASVQRGAGKPAAVQFRHASANFSEPRYRSSFEIVGVHTGWKLGKEQSQKPHVSIWLPAAPLKLEPGDQMTLSFPNVPAGCIRVSFSPFVPADPNDTALPANLKDVLESRSQAQRAYLLGTGWNAEAFARAKEIEADLLECRSGRNPVMITEAWKPAVVRVLPRGNWQDESGPVVEPAVFHFLPGYQEKPSRRLSRLDLAKWLVSKENPLTARVFVNRLWKQYFGNGLSGIVEDLGAQGEWPTHPELLDWLAVEFRDGSGTARPWDAKHIVRLILTSATYRQSSSLRPELRDLDPANRLLASQNPRRLEAELVRDNALAVAGLLCLDMGGPSSKPYQPEGYYANLQFPDRFYVADKDERQWRRGVYMHWQRTFLHPMLANFDAPSREDCIAARIVANTPQQALTLLNDPSFVEAARAFARSLLESSGTDAERIDRAFQRAVARPAKAKERESLLAFLEKVRAEYKQRPDDAKKLLAIGYSPVPEGDVTELAAWTSVCRVVLNLQETITRY